MAEEKEKNVFKDKLNWKELTIDAVKTILSIAIGSLVGYFVSNYKNEKADEARNQKMIVATVSNIENYKQLIKDTRDQLQWIEDSFMEMNDMEEADFTDESLIDNFFAMYFQDPFPKQDTWIEENFITNGGFIRKTEVRLEIGTAYSIIDQCEREFKSLKKMAEPEYNKYLANYFEDEKKAVLNALSDNVFASYLTNVIGTKLRIDEYLAVLEDITKEIVEESGVDKESLEKMKKSSNNVKESQAKALSASESNAAQDADEEDYDEEEDDEEDAE